MLYASYDENHKITGFYDSTIHSSIPANAIEITREDWLKCLKNQGEYLIKQGKLIDNPSPPQLTSEQLMSGIRGLRDNLLQASDYTQLCDAPISAKKKQEWAIYRQQLRDFPSICDPRGVLWPRSPK